MPTTAPTKTAQTFGVNLRAARLNSGRTQAQVALAAGCDVKTVRRAESGQNVPLLDMAHALAAAVGATLGELASENTDRDAEQLAGVGAPDPT